MKTSAILKQMAETLKPTDDSVGQADKVKDSLDKFDEVGNYVAIVGSIISFGDLWEKSDLEVLIDAI